MPGATQVPACTPLVIEVIGVSSVGTSGQRSLNISRLTSPCSLATALERARQPQAHHRHVEALVGLVAGPVPELHELVDADAHLAGPRAEVALDQLAGEAVDAGRHRRVGGEDARRAHRLDGLAVREAGVLHELADALEAEEAGVALVGVEHLGVDAERVEGAHAADAEEDLLAEAVLGLAAVEPVGDRPQVGRVLLDVGVEQVQRHPPDLRPPHARHERRAGQVDLDGARRRTA